MGRSTMHEYRTARMFEATGGGIDAEDRYISLLDVARFFRRWRRAMVWLTLAFGLAAAAYAFLTQPLFTAVAQVMLEDGRARDTLDDTNRPVIAIDQARVESHIQIMKSDQLALDVIHKLKLAELPEFHAPPGEKDKNGYALLAFGRNLNVRRVGQSLVMEVSFRFRNPVLATSITNTLINSYIAHEMTVKSDTIKRAETWLYDKQASFEDQTRSVLAEIKKYESQSESPSGHDAKLAELRD